jgi:hypothetical protein
MKFSQTIFIVVFSSLISFPIAAETQKDTDYRAAIWVDPDGCQHWVIDTGIEGFMSQRLTSAGKPVCNQPQTLHCASGAATTLNEQGEESCN